MSVLSAKGINKSYGARVVLRAADFSIQAGERIGVVGRNGCGKSTFASVVAGLTLPDAGSIARRRDATVSYLDQVPSFDGNPTAAEAVAEGLTSWSDALRRYEQVTIQIQRGGSNLENLLEDQQKIGEEVERLGGWDQRHRVDKMLNKLGIEDVEARVASLSGGEQRRVALARILIARPDLAIFDEPTNHLDAQTVEWLEEHLSVEYAGAVLLITHDRYLLDRVATRTLEISGGEVFSYDGGYELYLEQKAERLAHAERTEQNRQNFLRRELEWLRRQPKARGTKQKARIERAEAALATKAPKADGVAALSIEAARSGKTIVECRSLEVERNGKTLVHGLDLFLTEGERIGIVGKNGSGKTTLLRTLLGELPPASGEVTIGRNTKIAYFDQLRGGLDDEKSVFENVMGDQSQVVLGGRIIEPRSYLERFLFDGHQQRQPVSSLSGGERARVALARLLRTAANLVILDEPTNDLDVETLGALEGLLVDSGLTALIVTHDRYFLDRVATSILAFEGGGRVTLYSGNYEAYRSSSARQSEAPEKTPAQRVVEAASRPQKKALSYKERRELDGLPDAIEGLEARVASITEKLGDPSIYVSGGGDVQQLTSELEGAKQELERMMHRWEELEQKAQPT